MDLSRRAVVLLSAVGLALAACGEEPRLGRTHQALSTARVIESTVQTVGDIGGGDYEWTIRVNFVGLGGTCGVYEQADVAVVNSSPVALPSAVTRCSAYADAVPACAAHTIGTLGCDILTYALTTPL